LYLNSGQRGRLDPGAFEHKLGFPLRETLLELPKIPPDGICPSKSLNERLSACRELSDARNSGIFPDKLFRERSISLMLFKFMKDCGILPVRKFPSM
jgi:hypothetical protein